VVRKPMLGLVIGLAIIVNYVMAALSGVANPSSIG